MGKFGKFLQSPGGAAAISAVGSASSGLFGGLFAARQQRRQYKYNLKLQKQQQQWQKEMWDLENQYNLPVNEIQRLLDAGINPALAFSNGGASAAPVPSSGSAGGVSAPTASMPNVGASAVQAAQASQALENQTQLAKSQSDLNEALANKANADAGVQEVNKDIASMWRDVYVENKPIYMQLPALRLSTERYENAIRGNMKAQSDIYTAYYPTMVHQDVQLKDWQIKIASKESRRIEAQIALYQSQGRLNDAQAARLRQQIRLSEADALVADFTAEFYRNIFHVDRKGGVNRLSPEAHQFLKTLRNQFANALSRSELNKVEVSNQIGFEVVYGLDARRLGGHTIPLRSANKLTTDQWTSVAGTFLDLAGSVVSGANSVSSIKTRSAWLEASKHTGEKFIPKVYEYYQSY